MRRLHLTLSGKTYKILTLCILIFLVISPVAAQVLGILPFPVIINDRYYGEIHTTVDDQEGFLISSIQLREKVQTILDPAILGRFDSLPEWVSVDKVLEQTGIDVFIDTQSLTVLVSISPKQKKIDTISLISSYTSFNPNSIIPSNFSFYVNLNGYAEVDLFSNTQFSPDSTSYSLLISPVLQAGGWVLQSDMEISAEDNVQLSLNRASLIKDFTEAGLRLQGGSLLYESIPHFQSATTAFGLSLTNNYRYTNNNDSLINNSLTKNVYLATPSKVDIFVNDTLRKSLSLPSGRFVFQDFSLAQGINDITIAVNPNNADAYTDSFTWGYDSAALPAGIDKFTYALGYSDPELILTSYPTFFGMHKLGISNSLTAGYGIQADLDMQQLSLDSVYVSGLGNFHLAGSLTHADNTWGGAVYAKYLFARYNTPSFAISGTYYTPNYQVFGSDTPETKLLSISTSSNYAINQSIGLSGLVTAEVDKDSYELGLTGSLRVTANISDELTLSAHGKVDITDQVPTYTGTIQVTYHPDSNSSVNTFTDIATGKSNVTMFLSPTMFSGSGNMSLGISGITTDGKLPEVVSLSGSYKNDLFYFNLLQQAILGSSFSDPYQLKTNINASTALAYVDGYFGISRPITDSFVIIGADNNLEDMVFGVKSSSNSISTSKNLFNTVVIQNISSYTNNKVEVDIIDLPRGYNPGITSAVVNPGYKQGAFFGIGTDTVVYGTGKLLYSDQKPVSYALGEVSGIHDDTFQIQKIFTDESGSFFIYDLKAGTYEIVFEQLSNTIFEFTIAPDDSGLKDLGVYHIPYSSSENTDSEGSHESYILESATDDDALQEQINDISVDSQTGESGSGSTPIDNAQANAEIIDIENTPLTDSQVNTIVVADEQINRQHNYNTISGKVLFENGYPLAFGNGGLYKIHDDAFNSMHFTVNYDGSFMIDNLPPGEYSIVFFYQGENEFSFNIPDNNIDFHQLPDFMISSSGIEVSVIGYNDGDTNKAVLDSIDPASPDFQILVEIISHDIFDSERQVISGIITDQVGNPLPFLNCSIHHSTGYAEGDVGISNSSAFFTTDENGMFNISLEGYGNFTVQLAFSDLIEYSFFIPQKVSLTDSVYLLDTAVIL